MTGENAKGFCCCCSFPSAVHFLPLNLCMCLPPLSEYMWEVTAMGKKGVSNDTHICVCREKGQFGEYL